MAIYIKTNPSDAIVLVLNSDGPFPIPGGAIQITTPEAITLRDHPQGFGVFDYTGGQVVLNAARAGAMSLTRNRRKKIEQIKAHALALMAAIESSMGDWDTVSLLIAMTRDGMTNPPDVGTPLRQVQAILQYGKTKITQARTATQAQLDQYDPATDSNWP